MFLEKTAIVPSGDHRGKIELPTPWPVGSGPNGLAVSFTGLEALAFISQISKESGPPRFELKRMRCASGDHWAWLSLKFGSDKSVAFDPSGLSDHIWHIP